MFRFLFLVIFLAAPAQVVGDVSNNTLLRELESEFELAARSAGLAQMDAAQGSASESFRKNRAIAASFRYFHMKDVLDRTASYCAKPPNHAARERCYQNETGAPSVVAGVASEGQDPFPDPPYVWFGLLKKMEARVEEAKADSETLCGKGGFGACLARLTVWLRCDYPEHDRLDWIAEFLSELPIHISLEDAGIVRTAMLAESDMCGSQDSASPFSGIELPKLEPGKGRNPFSDCNTSGFDNFLLDSSASVRSAVNRIKNSFDVLGNDGYGAGCMAERLSLTVVRHLEGYN